jgi:hypothetical protein
VTRAARTEKPTLTAREFILERFRLASARKQGGVSSGLIFGAVGLRLYSIPELEQALRELRDGGVLAYTGGLWWLREAARSA